MQNNQIFLVGSHGLACPVKAASYQYLPIYQTVLIVHVRHFVVVGSAWHTKKTKSPNISTVELCALVICDQSDCHALSKHKGESLRKNIIRKSKDAAVDRLLGSPDYLRKVFNVLSTWEKHRLVVLRLLLESTNQVFHDSHADSWTCFFVDQESAESVCNSMGKIRHF